MAIDKDKLVKYEKYQKQIDSLIDTLEWNDRMLVQSMKDVSGMIYDYAKYLKEISITVDLGGIKMYTAEIMKNVRLMDSLVGDAFRRAYERSGNTAPRPINKESEPEATTQQQQQQQQPVVTSEEFYKETDKQ